MAVTVEQRTPEQTEVAVRVVDTDVHPVPRGPDIFEYLPEPLRSTFWKRREFHDPGNYDAPGYAQARAMRMDSFPQDGGFPGSDPDLAFRQVIMEAGCDIGILEPL